MISLLLFFWKRPEGFFWFTAKKELAKLFVNKCVLLPEKEDFGMGADLSMTETISVFLPKNYN